MKILIFKKNSPWGVLKYPQKPNEYLHVVNFPNDSFDEQHPLGVRKHAFINKYLMDNTSKDWLTELNKQADRPSVTSTLVNEVSWKVKVDLKKYKEMYPEFKRRDLINADCCVVEDDGFYYFCVVAFDKVVGNNLYAFDVEIDVPFTYPDMFNFREGTSNFIGRSHIKRFDIVNQEIKPLLETLTKEDSLMVEPVNETQTKVKSFYCTNGLDNIDIRDSIDNLKDATDLEKEKFKSLVDNIRFGVFYIKTYHTAYLAGKWVNDLGVEEKVSGEVICINNDKQGANLPYVTAIVPFVQNQAKYNVTFIHQKTKRFDFDFTRFYEVIGRRGGQTLEPTSIQVYNQMPNIFKLNFIKNTDKWYLNFTSNNCKYYHSKNNLVNLQTLNDIGFFKLQTSIYDSNLTKTNEANEYQSLQTVKDLIGKNFELEPSHLSIEKPKHVRYETKLLSPQFLQYELALWYGQKINYNLYQLYNSLNEDVCIKGNFSFVPEEYQVRFFVNKLYNTSNPFMSGFYLQDINNVELPITTVAFEKYMNENRKSMSNKIWYGNAQRIAGSAGVAVGAVSAVSSSLNPMAWLTGSQSEGLASSGKLALASAGVLAKGQKDIWDVEATMEDLARVPNQVTPSSGILKTELMNGENEWGLFWRRKELRENDKQKVFDYLTKYGYNYRKYGHLGDFINTRYYYNYVQATDVFNSIKPLRNLSSAVKQIMSDIYARGVTIWHVRDIDTFKGVLNYNYENWEIEHLNENNEIPYTLTNSTSEVVDYSGSVQTLLNVEPIQREDLVIKTYQEAVITSTNEAGEQETEIVQTDKPTETTHEEDEEVVPPYVPPEHAKYVFVPYKWADQGSSYWRFGLWEYSSITDKDFELGRLDGAIKLDWKSVKNAISLQDSYTKAENLVRKFDEDYDVRVGTFTSHSIKKFEVTNTTGGYGATIYNSFGLVKGNRLFTFHNDQHQIGSLNLVNLYVNTSYVFIIHKFLPPVNSETYSLKIWLGGARSGKHFSMTWQDDSSYEPGGYWYAQVE